MKRNMYMNNEDGFKISINDNIKLALDATLNSFKEIYKEPDNVEHYKLGIINLHNSLELTFKFMLLQRNEFMIFSMGGNRYSNVINAYKKARSKGEFSMLNYYENNPSEPQLHTVSFKDAYEILVHLYKCNGFDDRFLFELEILEVLRNKLTHFEATIRRIDFIILDNLFNKCIGLYNKEIELNELKADIYGYTKYINHLEMEKNFYSINKKILLEVLDKKEYRLILGNIVNEFDKGMYNLSFREYDKIVEICYELNKKEFKEIFNEKSEAKIKEEIGQSIYLLKEAELIEEGDICDNWHIPIMSRIQITGRAKDIIKEKFQSNIDICREMSINEESVRYLEDYWEEDLDKYWEEYLEIDDDEED